MAEWQRSELILYPLIWSEFSIFNPINNEMEFFVIMDIPEYLHETVIMELTRYSIENTPTELRTEISTDLVFLVEREESWRMALKQRLSLMCVLKHADGWQKIVAVSINARRSLFDQVPKFEGKRMRWMRSIQDYIYGKRFFYDDFNVTEIIVGMCAYVRPEFSATKVPVAMFECRGLLCKATNISLCLACIEIREDQYDIQDAAVKAGFVDYIRVPYEEVARIDRKHQLPKCEMFTLMYNFYV